MLKLSTRGGKYVLSVLRKRGKGKIVAVASKTVVDASPATLLEAAVELNAFADKLVDRGGI